jgi:hypothetical protein
MKKIVLSLSVIALIASCTPKTKVDSMAGVYHLEKQVVNDGAKDFTYLAADGRNQIKIYTPDSYFYITMTNDTSVGFGVGSYTINEGKVVETNIFNSGSLDSANTATLEISNKSDKGYTQFIDALMMRGTSYKLTEEYSTIASSGTSALDGVWHQVKNIEINGTDSTDRTYNEYKVFHGGHFMWAARVLQDTANNGFSNVIGHGSFTLADNALTENLEMSSMKGITGKYNIILSFNGTDEFTQKTADTSSKVVGYKTYKKISK